MWGPPPSESSAVLSTGRVHRLAGRTLRMGREYPVRAPAAFRQNMVMSTETFMATEGVGSAGFEQNFIVTAESTELVTNTPVLWWD